MKIIISNISKSSIDVVICQVSAYLKKVSGYYVKLEGEAFNSSEKQIKGCFFRIPTLPKGNAEVSLRFVKNDRNIIKRKRRSGREAEGAPLLREYTFYRVSRVRISPSPPYKQKSPLEFSRGLFCLYGICITEESK